MSDVVDLVPDSVKAELFVGIDRAVVFVHIERDGIRPGFSRLLLNKRQHLTRQPPSTVILVQIELAQIQLVSPRVHRHKSDIRTVVLLYEIVLIAVAKLIRNRRNRLEFLNHVVVLLTAENRIVMFLHNRRCQRGQLRDSL